MAQQAIIERYIKQGLDSNLALKQQNFNLLQSLEALREARGMFLPALEFNARYSRAGGGRKIEIPIGSIVNPIYRSINEILENLGQNPYPYPTLEDTDIPFLREQEHETKIRFIQPIFQPTILYNYKLKYELKNIKTAERDVFKRQLVEDIKRAYINFLKIDQIVKLFRETKLLLKENLRVSDKLYKAQKATHDVVYRSQAELSRMEQNILESENQRTFTQFYFNFLLNRQLDADIEAIEDVPIIDKSTLILSGLIDKAIRSREELKQLEYAISASHNSKNIAKSNYWPGITAVVDYGFQGKEYRFTNKDDFWMASLVFNWNIFKGFQDNAKVERAELEKRKIETQYEELKKQIELQARQAYDNLILAYKKIEVSQTQLISSSSSFNIVNKKYQQGMITQVEFIDARTNLTNAQINSILANYDFFIDYTVLERITAQYILPE
jgi:outer membrane protein TolC